MLQRCRKRNQGGDFGSHGRVSTKSLPDCCTSSRQAEKILWIFIGTWWVSIFIHSFASFVSSIVSKFVHIIFSISINSISINLEIWFQIFDNISIYSYAIVSEQN